MDAAGGTARAGRKLPRSAEERERGLELPGRLPALRLLVQWMLSPVPEARPSAAELVKQVRRGLVQQQQVHSRVQAAVLWAASPGTGSAKAADCCVVFC